MNLTTRQVAKRLGRSTRTVREMVAAGRLKAKRDLATGTLYVAEAEVDRFERDDLADYDKSKDKARRPRRREPAKPAETAAPAAADPGSAVENASKPPSPALTGSTPAPEPAPAKPAETAAPAPPQPAPSKPAPPSKKGGFGFF